MFKSFGVVIILWYLSSLFSQSFSAADSAFKVSFEALEAVVVAGEKQIVK